MYSLATHGFTARSPPPAARAIPQARARRPPLPPRAGRGDARPDAVRLALLCFGVAREMGRRLHAPVNDLHEPPSDPRARNAHRVKKPLLALAAAALYRRVAQKLPGTLFRCGGAVSGGNGGLGTVGARRPPPRLPPRAFSAARARRKAPGPPPASPQDTQSARGPPPAAPAEAAQTRGASPECTAAPPPDGRRTSSDIPSIHTPFCIIGHKA